MSFEITFLGASGGPVEGNTCSLLVKPATISYKKVLESNSLDLILCVDGGSGLGQLSDIIYHEVHGQATGSPDSCCKEKKLYNDSIDLKHYSSVKTVWPFKDLDRSVSPYNYALRIYGLMKSYLVTHPHLDHIVGMVINTAAPGGKAAKHVYGSINTLEAMEKHIFNDIIWPNMPRVGLVRLEAREFWRPFEVNENYVVTAFDVSHGTVVRRQNEFLQLGKILGLEQEPLENSISNSIDKIETYLSTAFLITWKQTDASLLVFGDFESDVVSKLNKNQKIWRSVAPLIIRPRQLLKGVVLECSSYRVESTSELYGHLTPEHLIQELLALKQECILQLSPELQDEFSFKGLNFIINHVKESCDGLGDPRRKILDELRNLSRKHDLDVNFSIALSGHSIIL